jgi:hypothetical protein
MVAKARLGGGRGAAAGALVAALIVLAARGAVADEGRDRLFGPAGLLAVTLRTTAELRFRYEYDDQLSVKGYEPGTLDRFLLERLRLNLDFQFGAGLRFFLQIQDAHVLGTRFGERDFQESNPFEDILDIRQAFLEWLRIGGTPFGIRAGRQQISYGDQRVFGPGNWGNTGRYAWDAFMVKVDTDRFWVDLWVGRYLRNRPELWPNRPVGDPTYYVAYGQLKRLPFRLDLFYALLHDSSGQVQGESGLGDAWRHSLGFQLEGETWGTLLYGATFVAQLGSSGQDTVRAFGLSAQLGARLPIPWRPRIIGKLTWGSGDADPHDGVSGTFDNLVGGRDIYFYGYLNLFSWANLRDYEVNLHLEPHRTLQVMLEYHYFTLDQARDAWYTSGLKPLRRDLAGASGVVMGHEIDVRLVWRPIRSLELMPAYGRFFPGAFVTRTGKAPAANWYSFQVTYFYGER